MGRLRIKRPSPAMLVAIVALVFALAGSSIAAVNALTKKQKSQTRKIAQSEIAKAAPGLSVAHAKQADGVAGGSIGPAELSKSTPAVHVTRTGSAQSIEGGAQIPLSFNAERYDTAGLHDNTTNNSRLTAPIDGIYAITAQIDWEPDGADPAAEHELIIIKNDTAPIAQVNEISIGGDQIATTQAQLHAGDYVEAEVLQDSSAFIDVNVKPEYSPEFAMTWLAPGP